jgi:hypothetical protein
MMTRNVKFSILGLFMMPLMYGQNDSARIAGTVADASGAVIANAAITIKNEKTGQERKVVADDRGFYVIPNLAPSSYTIIGQGSGLGPAQYTEITLSVAST